jgi:serine/threonine protein kinase
MAEPDFEVIGPYKVLRVLGRGGMGTVYQGVHGKTEQAVAVKVISEEMAQHQRFRRRFNAEIQTLVRLKHPCIVNVIGVGEERGRLFYSMEYIDGENLHQRLKRVKRIAWTQVLDWAIDIASALKHAHDFGIIHRDLKPANLMLDSQNRIKLTDFGIAKLYGAEEATVPGSVIGTADFMPPEQAEGQAVTPRSDLYALGAICYACIAGRPPFTGTNVPEILFNVRYGVYAPIGTLCPDVPEEFARLIDELLSRSVANRPPTAYLVLSRLQSLRAGLSKTLGKSGTGNVDDLKDAGKGVGKEGENTSIDVSAHPSVAGLAVPEDSTRLLPPGDDLRAGSGNKIAGQESDQRRGAVPTRAPATRVVGGEGKGVKDQTLDAAEPRNGGRLSDEGPASGLQDVRATNFTEVTEEDRVRTSVLPDLKTPEEVSGRWGEVFITLAAIGACLLAIYYFTRPVSPERLLGPIQDAVENRDEAKLLELEESIVEFQKLHHTHPDIDVVYRAVEEIDFFKRLRTIRRGAGKTDTSDTTLLIDPLRHISKVHQDDRERSLELLDALLAAYDPALLSESQLGWLEFASRLKREWQEEVASEKYSKSRETLESYVQKMRRELTAESFEDHFAALKELYRDVPWALPILERLEQEFDQAR